MPSSNTHTFKSTQKMQKYKNQKSMDMKRKINNIAETIDELQDEIKIKNNKIKKIEKSSLSPTKKSGNINDLEIEIIDLVSKLINKKKELKSLTSKKITGGKTLRRKSGKKNKSIKLRKSKLTFFNFISNML